MLRAPQHSLDRATTTAVITHTHPRFLAEPHSPAAPRSCRTLAPYLQLCPHFQHQYHAVDPLCSKPPVSRPHRNSDATQHRASLNEIVDQPTPEADKLQPRSPAHYRTNTVQPCRPTHSILLSSSSSIVHILSPSSSHPRLSSWPPSPSTARRSCSKS